MIDLEKIPVDSKVNTPSSGTYGEKAANERLKQQLPTGDGPQGPGAGAGLPPMSDQPVRPQTRTPGAGAGLPPGVPGPLAAPTTRPDVPVSTPLGASPAAPPVLTAQQQRLRILDMLSESEQVSPTTREWARSVRRVLVGG